MAMTERIGEVIAADTTAYTAQCYELYALPPLGSLVKTMVGDVTVYGVVAGGETNSLEPGRRPLARGKDEASEADVFRASPQLSALLRSEFQVLVIGNRREERIFHYLPPQPAHIHGFVYDCPPGEMAEFCRAFGFLSLLLSSRLTVSSEELVAACLRRLSSVQDDRRAFLVSAGKELALHLGGDYQRLKTILERIRE
jgi:hypothetical protein